MPYWENYLCTKPEVDDDDLPLPQHRIFDDYGNLKAQAARREKSLYARKAPATAAAKRDTYVLQKFLRIIFPRQNTMHAKGSTRNVDSMSARSPKKGTPNTSGIKKSSGGHAGTRAQTPTKTETPRKLRSPGKHPNSSSTGARSPKVSPLRGKRSALPVPVATATVVLRSASRSRSTSPSAMKQTPVRVSRGRKSPVSRRRSSRTRSVSRRSSSGSPKKRGASQASGSPNSKWAVVALREYAKNNKIATRGLRTKSDILSAIRGARS